MKPGVALIMLSKVDLVTLLPLARKILGYSLANQADGVDLKEQAHQLVCVSAFKDKNVDPAVKVTYAAMFHAGFVIVAEDQDMGDILEVAGMPFILTETLKRGIQAAIVTGLLSQWQFAVKRGCDSTQTPNVRFVFNAIFQQLKEQGLGSIFGNVKAYYQNDHTFLLEDQS